MAFLLNFFKGIRNHWKKSTFALGAASYGVAYAKEKYEIRSLMRKYCEEAVKYGDITTPVTEKPRSVTVILNPAANKRAANDLFENYCEPLLHLAGIIVTVIKTGSEGHARTIVEEMDKIPDAILVAGGDGTLAEAVTGLLRRSDKATCPIGVLPLGRVSNVGSILFPGSKAGGLTGAKGLADAAMAVVRGNHIPKDVMKVEVLTLNEEKKSIDGDENPKPVYAVGTLQWGAFRDVASRRDKYWYFGPLRDYAAYVFNGYKDSITWNCNAKMIYSDPCDGCNNCKIEEPQINKKTSWWRGFLPSINQKKAIEMDYSKIENKNCSRKHEKQVNTTELFLTTRNAEENEHSSKIPKLFVKLGPKQMSYADFVSEGWNRTNGTISTVNERLHARTIDIIPEKISTEKNETWYAIDNEEYEVKPIRVTLVPKAINMFSGYIK